MPNKVGTCIFSTDMYQTRDLIALKDQQRHSRAKSKRLEKKELIQKKYFKLIPTSDPLVNSSQYLKVIKSD